MFQTKKELLGAGAWTGGTSLEEFAQQNGSSSFNNTHLGGGATPSAEGAPEPLGGHGHGKKATTACHQMTEGGRPPGPGLVRAGVVFVRTSNS